MCGGSLNEDISGNLSLRILREGFPSTTIFHPMNSYQIRQELERVQSRHELLSNLYLEMCEESEVEPYPVVWITEPPMLSGQTRAYLMFEHGEEVQGQPGVDLHAETGGELAHQVFLRALLLRSVNA